jgi:2-keto-myo-inositol isomerase
MGEAMLPCISEATTLPASFAEDVANFASASCPRMEVWLTKLEKHLESHSADATRQLLADKGVQVVAASYQGGLLLSQGQQRQAHFDHFRRRLDICGELGIGILNVVADFAGKIEQTDLERAVVSLKQAAQWAEAYSVRLGLEFRAGGSFCASLDTALWLIDTADEPNLGVCLDVFHYYTGPSKFDDLDLLRPERLALVQVCDLAGVPRELAGDSDRVLPGDGDFRLEPIIAKLQAIGYTGPVSLEVLNPTLWQVKPTQVLELGMAAMRRLLGLEQPPSK